MEEFVCKICNRKFKSLVALSKHYVLSHNISREELYNIYHPNEITHICKNCGKTTTLKKDKLEYNEFCNRKCAIEYHWKEKENNNLNNRTEKLKEAWNNKSEDELKDFSEKCKQTYHSRSQENIDSIKLKMKSTWKSKDKSEWISKHKKSWKNKSEEEKKINTSRMVEYWKNMSDEEKEEKRLKLKETWNNKPQNELIEIYNKRYNKIIDKEKYIVLNDKILLENYLKENNKLSLKELSIYFGLTQSGIGGYIHRYNFEDYISWDKSLPEQEVYDYIKSIYSGKIIRNNRSILFNNKELDIYIPEKNLAIEFNGCYWHSKNNGTLRNYHQDKSKECLDKNIRLIHIYEDEWMYKQDIIKDIIKSALGVFENKIYARKCEVRVVDKQTYKDYCQKYHLQSYSPAQIILGLYYQDQLIQLASFSKSRYDKNYEYEWIRGVQLPGYQVIGGTSKLFSYFVKNYNPSSIICYSDFNKFSGNSYKNCGFMLDKITTPDMWFNEINGLKRINRQPSKHQLTKSLVESGDLLEMHGAGNMKWIWRKP